MLVNGNFSNHDYRGDGYTGSYQLRPKHMGNFVNKHVHNRIPKNKLKKTKQIQGVSLSVSLFLYVIIFSLRFGYFWSQESSVCLSYIAIKGNGLV